MNETRDPKQDPQFFSSTAQHFVDQLELPMFKTKEEANGFIRALDNTIDVLVAHMQENNMNYSDSTILNFGSVLGEAFRVVFGGQWKFSEGQNRWVIVTKTKDGSRAEINVFNKLQKRIENGMEDSITYYFQMLQKTLVGELDI